MTDIQLSNITFNADDIENKTTIMYGASGTGKSSIIKDLLYQLHKRVPTIIVVCPTDAAHKTYSSGMVPTPFIHENLTGKLLEDIWNRQEMMSNIYSNVNNFNTLESLYKRLNLNYVDSIIQDSEEKKASRIAQLQEHYTDRAVCKSKIAEVNTKFNNFLKMIFKKYINTHKDKLDKMQLTLEERTCLKHLNINPKMVLVLDDCSADFKNLKTKEHKSVLEKMFYQGRHNNLTLIIAIHDDKVLHSELRKTAFISIFTSTEVAQGFFTRESNSFSKNIKKQIGAITREVFDTKFQKLVYKREYNTYHTFTADPSHEFAFGAGIIKSYCSRIAADENSIDMSNPFYNYF